MKCAVNQRQVVIALTGGELVYFEMDPVSSHCIQIYWVLDTMLLLELNMAMYHTVTHLVDHWERISI